jgi:hypothetical protein
MTANATSEKLDKAVLTKGNETLTVLHSARRDRCQKIVKVDGRVTARNTVRGDLHTFRTAVRDMVKWGWTLVSDTTADDKDDTTDERFEAARETVQARALEITPPQGVAPRMFSDLVAIGFVKLASRQPSRLTKLYASLDAGRTDDVVYALYSYMKALSA